MYLRAAHRNDCYSLATLRAASLVELNMLAAHDQHAFITEAIHGFNVLFRADRILAWVACNADLVVACSCAVFYDRLPYPDGSLHAELCGVYVLPAYRNAGLASELVREVVADAQAGGARKTFLRPSPAAKAIYARLGFVDTDLMTFEHDASARPTTSRAAGVPQPLSGYACGHEYGNHPC